MFLNGLMWVIFGSKCVKFVLFSILEDYKQTDVDALRPEVNRSPLVSIVFPFPLLLLWFP